MISLTLTRARPLTHTCTWHVLYRMNLLLKILFAQYVLYHYHSHSRRRARTHKTYLLVAAGFRQSSARVLEVNIRHPC